MFVVVLRHRGENASWERPSVERQLVFRLACPRSSRSGCSDACIFFSSRIGAPSSASTGTSAPNTNRFGFPAEALFSETVVFALTAEQRSIVGGPRGGR